MTLDTVKKKKKVAEILDSLLFVRKAERTAGVAFLRASFQT